MNYEKKWVWLHYSKSVNVNFQGRKADVLPICLSYEYFLVVIFALRHYHGATLTRFNLGLNNMTTTCPTRFPSSTHQDDTSPSRRSHDRLPSATCSSLYSLSADVFTSRQFLDWFQSFAIWTLGFSSYIRTRRVAAITQVVFFHVDNVIMPFMCWIRDRLERPWFVVGNFPG